MSGRSAFVLTVSDRSARGERADASGPALAARLEGLGFRVERDVVPDEPEAIAGTVRRAAAAHDLVVTTGGTGLTARDVTPQALRGVIDYEIPGLGELMRGAGRAATPFAALSRSFGARVGDALLLALPGSPRGAVESLDAIAELLPHALELVTGRPDAGGPAGHPAGAVGPGAGEGPLGAGEGPLGA